MKEYIATIVVSILCSVLWLYAFNYKLFGRFLRFIKIKATKKFGDEDLWDFVFNSADPRVEYAYVRDYENKKIFSGWVVGYSGGDKFRELLLRVRLNSLSHISMGYKKRRAEIFVERRVFAFHPGILGA